MLEQNYIDHKNITDITPQPQIQTQFSDSNSTTPLKLKTKKDIMEIPELTIHINSTKKDSQYKLVLDNIEIYFPYKPYKIQEIYMQKIIENLNKKFISKSQDTEFNGIAALESPTGTGKTLCLLCSILGWVDTMRRQNKFFGKIIYTTRTHSQISQAISELKKTCYEPKLAILSSREFSCINTELKNSFDSTVLDIKCSKEHRKCRFYKESEFYSNVEFGCVDIEEIVKKGKAKMFCPFYTERIRVKKGKSDLIFMPYNYIFQKEIRETMDIHLNNNILIIDEAHNVTQNCEEAQSVEVTFKDFQDMLTDLKEIIKERNKNINFTNKKELNKEEEMEEEKEEEEKEEENEIVGNNQRENYNINSLRMDCLLREINSIKNIMNNLKSKKEEITERDMSKKNYIEIDSSDFLSIFLTSEEKIAQLKKEESKAQKTIDFFFKQANIENGEEEYDEISKISQYITEKNIKKHIYFINRLTKAIMQDYLKRTKLSKLVSILEKIKDYLENKDIINSYIFCLSDEKVPNHHNTFKKIIKLNIFCFNPGIGFNHIMKFKPYSTILTSGTLAPFDILENELKIKFDITLENEHIIDKSQYKFAIIKKMQVKNKTISFNFEFNNRSDLTTIASLGITILNLCKSVKSGGILVYFTSYKYLNECYDLWGESTIISQISKFKTIFFDNKKNKNLISDYKNKKDKNSILFSVFRGVSSEGIDFKDDFARMVVCVGVPYASVVEEKIQLKKKYLDKICKEGGSKLDGKKWYLNDAISNVNQTLGRVLRHKDDYGVLICIDERYEIHYKNKLFSKWIRDKCEVINVLENKFIDSLVEFFNEQDKKYKLNKEENIINNYNPLDVNIKDDENDNEDDIDEKNNDKGIGGIFKRRKKEIKYEFEYDEDESNNNSIKKENISINEIKNEKEILDDLENKYLSTYKDIDLLSKKTKPKPIEINKINNNTIDENYNNEDINLNHLNLTTKKEESKNINQNKNSEKKNQKKDELDILFEDIDNYKFGAVKNDIKKKIEDMITNLDNNINTKIFDKQEDFFCTICYDTENPNLIYSQSKCNHIFCNKCWAKSLSGKLECPLCKRKVREKTLTRLIKKS